MSKIAKLLLAVALLYPVIVLIIFPKWTVDDAYITFRYADNLAKHGELNWNIGEDPVEGYTGVALPVILAGFIKLGFSPIVVSQYIGVLSFFLGWLMLWLILRKLKIHELVQSAILLLYGTTPILFTHALSGLETMLFICVIIACIYALLRSILDTENHRRNNIVLFLLLLLVGLIRPEGVVLAGLFIIAAGYVKYKYYPKELKSFIISFIFFYLLPASAYFIWRVGYYGQFFPNTYYVKSGIGFQLGNLIDILRFVRRFFAAPLIAGLLLFSIETDWFWKKIKEKSFPFLDSRMAIAALAGIVFMFIFAAMLARSHLAVNYSTRFYMPFLPMFWIGLAFIFNLGFLTLKNSEAEKPLRYGFVLVLFVIFNLYQVSFQITKLKDEVRFARDQISMHENQHNLIGKTLKEIIPPSEWLIVYLDAGAIPYFSELKTVDFGGLNDETLAKKRPSPNEAADYFYSFNPGAAVFTSVDSDKLDYGNEAGIITGDPRFNNYVLFKKYISPTPYFNYHEFVYLRQDLAFGLK